MLRSFYSEHYVVVDRRGIYYTVGLTFLQDTPVTIMIVEDPLCWKSFHFDLIVLMKRVSAWWDSESGKKDDGPRYY